MKRNAATIAKAIEVIKPCGEPEVSVIKQGRDRKVDIDLKDLEFFGTIEFCLAESLPAGEVWVPPAHPLGNDARADALGALLRVGGVRGGHHNKPSYIGVSSNGKARIN